MDSLIPSRRPVLLVAVVNPTMYGKHDFRSGKTVVNYKQGKRIADTDRRHMYDKHTEDSKRAKPYSPN